MYDASQKVKYLDMVIQESTRLYTPVPKYVTSKNYNSEHENRDHRILVILCFRCIRLCSKTVTIGGVTIPKGANVVIPIDFIHHMPEYWPDPYKFDPERYDFIAWSFLLLYIHLSGSHLKQRQIGHNWLTCHLVGAHATVLV